MKFSKMTAMVLAGVAMLGIGLAPAQATMWTLTDDNSTAEIDTGSQDGMFEWTVDGVDNLFQQWFWYRVGSAGPEASLDTLTIGAEGTTDTNFDGSDETLFTEFIGTGFTIEITWSLDGGSIGSNLSDVAESITITNTGANPLDFHFFQYSDFDLAGTFSNDSVVLAAPNTWQQTDPSGPTLSETIATPPADHFEAGIWPDTRDALNDGVATTLSDFGGPLGPDDVTWAWQWDFSLAPGGSFQISKDKQLRIPAPGAALLAMLGMGMIGRVRRRFA